MADEMALFPEFDKLQIEVERMRTELSMLLLERDELQFVICRNIETQYMLKIGDIEYRVYEAQCAVLRLKRKLELIQSKQNRQEKIDIAEIENMLNKEFSDYQKKLDEQIEKMNEALRWNEATALSDNEEKKLKMLYHKLVKILHPDMNPQATDAQVELFEHALMAYQNGDLETMRLIDAMVGNGLQPEQSMNAIDQLKKEKQRLAELLDRVQKSVAKIKSEYPYTMKEVLEDEQKVQQIRQEYEDILDQYEEMVFLYRTKIEELLRC